MYNLYYKVWAEAINAERTNNPERQNWKLYTLIPITVLQSINLFTFFYWLRLLVYRHLPLFAPVHIFNGFALDSAISIIITYFVPFLLLNYLLIFSYDQYISITAKYKDDTTKVYRNYALWTIGICFIPVIIKILFFS